LPLLAAVRCQSDVTVALVGDRAWLHWPAGDEAVLRCVLPVPGVVLYEQREGQWYRHGRSLPAFEVPVDVSPRPLHAVLTPAPVAIEAARPAPVAPSPLSLVREDRPRKTTALRCDLRRLAEWAEWAPTAVLARIQAARSGKQVLLLGPSLPPLPEAERYWGERVLVPLGYRVEPALPEAALVDALGILPEELLLFTEGGQEALSRSVLRPLTRGAVRLAVQEGA
jgi:hypothetical protein